MIKSEFAKILDHLNLQNESSDFNSSGCNNSDQNSNSKIDKKNSTSDLFQFEVFRLRLQNDLSSNFFNPSMMNRKSETFNPYKILSNKGSLNHFDLTKITKPEAFTKEQFEAYKSLLQELIEALRLQKVLIIAAPLGLDFTSEQLKKAFRKAAQIAHPDLGGDHERFLKLKKNYEILSQLVHTRPNSYEL